MEKDGEEGRGKRELDKKSEEEERRIEDKKTIKCLGFGELAYARVIQKRNEGEIEGDENVMKEMKIGFCVCVQEWQMF